MLSPCSPQEKLFCFCWLKIVQFFLCRFRRLFDGGANVLYVQLWEAVGNFKPTKCYHTFIAPKKQATMIYNPRLERQWLEEDNKIRQEELWEKSQKNLTDLEWSAKLKEHSFKKKSYKGWRYWKKISNEGTEVLFASWTDRKKNVLK